MKEGEEKRRNQEILKKFQDQITLYRSQHAHLVNEIHIDDGIKALMSQGQTGYILFICTDLWKVKDQKKAESFMDTRIIEFCGPITEAHSFKHKHLTRKKPLPQIEIELEVPSLAA